MEEELIIKIDKETKEKVIKLFEELGMGINAATISFYEDCIEARGFVKTVALIDPNEVIYDDDEEDYDDDEGDDDVEEIGEEDETDEDGYEAFDSIDDLLKDAEAKEKEGKRK